jgi:hypothetical protein
MKRTSFLLASLTAIALLSCSSDNLTSTAEDVNYPQTPALQKVVPPGDELQQTCGSKSYTASKTMGIPIDPKVTANSIEVEFTLPGTLPKDARLTKVEVNTGNITTNIGTLQVHYLQIRKLLSGIILIPWNGGANMTLATNDFNGEYARDTYYVSYNATCLAPGNYNGLPVNFCSRLYSNVKLILYYCQP